MLVGLLADSFFDTFVAVQLGLLLFADVALHAITAVTNPLECNRRRRAINDEFGEITDPALTRNCQIPEKSEKRNRRLQLQNVWEREQERKIIPLFALDRPRGTRNSIPLRRTRIKFSRNEPNLRLTEPQLIRSLKSITGKYKRTTVCLSR